MIDKIEVGDPVADSPVGVGTVTGFTERGYPQVNHVAVTWLRLTDGATYDPHTHVGGSKVADAQPASVPRNVTPQEDAVLRSAARRGAKIVHKGKMAAQPAPVPDLSSANRELYFAAYALADSICEDHPSLADVFNADSHGRLCSALAALDDHYGVTSPEVRRSLDARPAPEELSPEFTDTARAALLWVLWHHQGGSSPVGQPIRFALGMDAHERLNEYEIREAKRWAAMTNSTTAEFHKAQPAPVPVPVAWRVPVANVEAGKIGHIYAEQRELVSYFDRPIEPLYAAPVPPMEDPDCNYLAAKGEVCKKCGRIHRGIAAPGATK